jgi:hypothetical protein
MQTLDGKLVSGDLGSITGKEVEFSTPAGVVKTPLSLVLDIKLQQTRPLPASTKRIDVELIDGTQFKCKENGLVIKGGNVELSLLSGQTVKVKLKDVAHYLRDAQDAALQKQFRDILKKKVKTDRILRLVVDEKGNPTKDKDGNFELVFFKGAIGDADGPGKRIEFTPEGQNPKKTPLNILYGMTFYRTEPSALPTTCLVYDINGSTLVANTVTADKNGYKLTTGTGVKLELDKTAVARLDFNIGKLSYLSDLEPARVVEKSGSGLVVHYRRDRNFDDDGLRLEGKSFNKGLCVHAYTELEYNLGEKYKEFKLYIGVDERLGVGSKAQVTIECDEEKKFSKEITAKTKDYRSKPLVISVKGVTKLRIIVSSKNLLTLHDHVTLADAKVTQ